mmetsp:Transcript_12045/g.17548  ORF Transcript_12045/g.17548 Transcript_12045/m.17548 type:complete len:345 (-) Transcript_12045:158-1192(-)
MVAVATRLKNGKSNKWLKIAPAFVFLTIGYLAFSLQEAIKEEETLNIAVKCSNDPILPQRNFKEIAEKTGTDKVAAYKRLPGCLKDRETCTRKECEREKCRPWGHFYDTIYDRWLKKYSSDDAEEIQFLEIGYYNGFGFDAYSAFLPRAEKHSMEISCLPPGPRSEGKWPENWGNFAMKNPRYESLREARRLHCGDASEYDFLQKIWTEEMKRPDSPPLKVVVDDGAHVSTQMAASLFFWLPRIEPGGILVMEDIQPISDSNQFRTHILPQVVKDLHWCGNELKEIKDTRCFPTIQPLLMSVHCEMHICVFERNDVPALEPSKEDSVTPPDAFTNAQKCLFGPH